MTPSVIHNFFNAVKKWFTPPGLHCVALEVRSVLFKESSSAGESHLRFNSSQQKEEAVEEVHSLR